MRAKAIGKFALMGFKKLLWTDTWTDSPEEPFRCLDIRSSLSISLFALAILVQLFWIGLIWIGLVWIEFVWFSWFD